MLFGRNFSAANIKNRKFLDLVFFLIYIFIIIHLSIWTNYS